MVFYLKVNRCEEYTISNLRHWINSIRYIPDYDFYIICDKPELREKIKSKIISIDNDIKFLESEKTELKDIISHCTEPIWDNAGYAHLTTFWHAQKNKIDEFWNIDADDTLICADPMRVCEMIQCVEKHARKNDISAFSLDMWRSRAGGDVWSLGVTYVNSKIDWLKTIRQYYNDKEYMCMLNQMPYPKAIDGFIAYIKKCTNLKIETFYFENLRFVHFSSDIFVNPFASGLYHYRDNQCLFPILYYCYGLKAQGLISIEEDVIKFDIGLTDYEGLKVLASVSKDPKNLKEIVRERKKYYLKENVDSEENDNNIIYNSFEDKINIEKMDLNYVNSFKRMKSELFIIKNMMVNTYNEEKRGENSMELIGWGAGPCFWRNANELKEAGNIKKVCDNNPDKWGKEVIDGIKCISPKELEQIKNPMVIITVDDISTSFKIANQLIEMGITHFDHITNWIEYIQE